MRRIAQYHLLPLVGFRNWQAASVPILFINSPAKTGSIPDWIASRV
jgi:hypothetical protein